MAVGDWVPCQNYGRQTTAQLDPTSSFWEVNFVLVAVGNSAFGNLGEVATVEVESEVLTRRVVGWMHPRCATLDPHDILIRERIRVGLSDDIGNLSFFAESFEDASQANEAFLWERAQAGRLNANEVYWPRVEQGVHTGWRAIDVRVARRLRRQDVLVYTVQFHQLTAAPWNGSDLLTVIPHLRTWARTIET